jgi:hypothetical protein
MDVQITGDMHVWRWTFSQTRLLRYLQVPVHVWRPLNTARRAHLVTQICLGDWSSLCRCRDPEGLNSRDGAYKGSKVPADANNYESSQGKVVASSVSVCYKYPWSLRAAHYGITFAVHLLHDMSA